MEVVRPGVLHQGTAICELQTHPLHLRIVDHLQLDELADRHVAQQAGQVAASVTGCPLIA